MAKNYEKVFVANGHLEAEIMRIYLESGGLHPVVYQESAGMTYGLVMGPLAEARIMVPEDEVEKALAFISDIDNQAASDSPIVDEDELGDITAPEL